MAKRKRSRSGGSRLSAKRLRASLAHGAGRGWTLTTRAVQAFFVHQGTQLAAAMSYYSLLSLVPATIVLVAGFGLVLGEGKARTDVVDAILGVLPLSAGQGRSELEGVIDGITKNAQTLGTAALVGLLFTASALMGSVRKAVNIAFGERSPRAPLTSKALDILLVFGLGALVALSLAITLARGFAIEVGQNLGVPGDAIDWTLGAAGIVLPLIGSVVVYTVVYTVIPARKVRLRDVWPAVLFATLVYELVKRGFAVYVENFANYNAVYGSLGAVVAVLVFIYLAAIVLLIGAEMAALWPRVRSGAFDLTGGPSTPLHRSVWRLLKSLVVREREKH